MSTIRTLPRSEKPNEIRDDVYVLLLGPNNSGTKYSLYSRFARMYSNQVGTIHDSEELHITFCVDDDYYMRETIISGARFDPENVSKNLVCRVADVVIIGFDITERQSFDESKRFFDVVKQPWKKNPMIVAIGNKLDLADKRQVSAEEARTHFGNMTQPVPYFEMSVKTGENVDKAFEDILLLYIEYRKTNPAPVEKVKEPQEPKDKNNGKCTVL